MKPFKRSAAWAAAAMMALAGGTLAETIVLKDGTRYQGSIVSEDDQAILIELRQKGIVLRRRIPIDAIAERLDQARPAQPLEQIKTAQEAINLAADFFVNRQLDLARKYIARACQLDPKLLVQPQRLQPRAWQDFWHEQVVAIRLAGLAKDDIDARLKLIAFAEQAGLTARARDLVSAVQKLAPHRPEVVELVRRYQLTAARRIELDLRYALSEPVLLDQFQDEDVTIQPARTNRFLLAPFRYQVADRRYSLSAGATRVLTDQQKLCRVRGIALGQAQQTSGAYSTPGRLGRSYRQSQRTLAGPSAQQEGFRLDAQRAPLYEGIEPFLDEQGQPVLIWHNTRSPRPAQAAERYSLRGGRRGLGLAGRGARSRYRRPTPARRSRRQPSYRQRGPRAQQERSGLAPASGWAALLVEYPAQTSELSIQFPGQAPQTVDLTLLELIQPQADRRTTPEQDAAALLDLTRQVAAYLSSPSPIVTRLAVAWLANAASQYRQPRQDQPDPTIAAIDAGLLEGIASPDPLTAEWAWASFSARNSLPPETLLRIAGQPNQELLLRLLKLVGQDLAAARQRPGTAQQPYRAQQRSSRRRTKPTYGPARPGSQQQMSTIVPSSLPDSNASPVPYQVIQAVLHSQYPAVLAEAVRLIFQDATKQAVACLAEAPPPAKQAAIQALAQASSDQVKAAAIKTLLLAPIPELVPKIIKAAAGLQITISDPNDPLLFLPAAITDPQTRLQIVRLLRDASMQEVLDTPPFADLIRSVTIASTDPQLRRAGYELLIKQWTEAGGLAGQQAQPSLRRASPSAGGIQQFVIQAALEPDPAIQLPAVRALLQTGGLDTLVQTLQQNAPPARVAALLQRLAAEPQAARNDESFGLFAALLAHQDASVARAALAAITQAAKAYPADQQWRMRLAIKRYLSLDALVRLLGDAKPAAARAAAAVIRMLTSAGTAQAAALPSTGDPKAVLASLRKLSSRQASQPAGKYHLLLLAQVRMPRYELVDVRPGVKELASLQWHPTRATCTRTVQIVKQAAQQHAVLYRGRPISLAAAPSLTAEPQRRMARRPSRRRGTAAPAVSLQIDATAFLQAALDELTQAGQQRDGGLVASLAKAVGAITGRTGSARRFRIASPVPVRLDYLLLGAWQGTWSASGYARTSPQQQDYDRQFRVDSRGNVIVGKLPQPQVQRVWVGLEPAGQ